MHVLIKSKSVFVRCAQRKAKEEDAIKLAASDAGVASGPVYEVIGDPAALTDTYVRRIKRGVKTPQTFHSITTAQVGGWV